MATPIKSVTLSLVKTLSPRTPKLLAKSSNPKYTRQCVTAINVRCEDGPILLKSKKRLDYLSISPRNHIEVYSEVEHDGNIFTTANKQRAEKKNGNLFITTPVKKDLVKNGLSQHKTPSDILGKGSFGTVVKGLYKDTLVAVKIVKSKHYSTNLSDLNAVKLFHRNIVSILEVNMKPEENYVVIIMEYMDGTSELQTLLESNVELDGETKKRFIEDICSALQCCHDHGILHLDIKPKNILVFGNNQCKICDFGNSCAIENTANYEFQGTVAYAAPELLKGMIPTTQCDIYSVGMTIWQMEYRENPFTEWSTNEALIYNVVKHHARPKHKSSDDMITQLFEKCWHQDSIRRPKISEILKMLEKVT